MWLNVFGFITSIILFLGLCVHLSQPVVAYCALKVILSLVSFCGIFHFLYELTGDNMGHKI